MHSKLVEFILGLMILVIVLSVGLTLLKFVFGLLLLPLKLGFVLAKSLLFLVPRLLRIGGRPPWPRCCADGDLVYLAPLHPPASSEAV